jgi:hypothetical protein
MEMDHGKRPQDAGELLNALRQFTDQLPVSRFSESLHSEQTGAGNGHRRRPDKDSQI